MYIHTRYREKYFYEKETCNYMCAQYFTRENGVLEELQIWLGYLRIPLW